MSAIHRKLGLAVTLASLVAACGPSIAHSTAASSLAPDDAFSCVLRELTRHDFNPSSTERDAGLIRAYKPVGGFASLAGGNYRDEITAVILPEGAGGSSVKISVARSKQEGARERTTDGMTVPGSLKEMGAKIQQACTTAH